MAALTIKEETEKYSKLSIDLIDSLFTLDKTQHSIAIENYYNNRKQMAIERNISYKYFQQDTDFTEEIHKVFQTDTLGKDWKQNITHNQYGYIGYSNGHFADYFLFTTPKSKQVKFELSKFKFKNAYVIQAGQNRTEERYVTHYFSHPRCLNKEKTNTSKDISGYIYFLVYETPKNCDCESGSECKDCSCEECTSFCGCFKNVCITMKFTKTDEKVICESTCKCKNCKCIKQQLRCNNSCSCKKLQCKKFTNIESIPSTS